MFPVKYGPDFDTALETVVCEFFTRLDSLLLIPDFKQVKKPQLVLTWFHFSIIIEYCFVYPIKTAMWISDTPSVPEEFMQCVSKADDFKVLLRGTMQRGKLAKMNASGKCRDTSSSANCLKVCCKVLNNFLITY